VVPADTYLTLKNDSEGFYKEKGSKFLAFAYVVHDEEEIREKIADLRKKYFDARHHCYAYILGESGDKYRANDDGEPGHSAGDPILGQIRSHGLTNTLIVVVRYFGGTKLGVSGLIHAYKTAAQEAIENNDIVEKLILTQICIEFEYPRMNQVMKVVKDHELTLISQKLDLTCAMTIGVRLSDHEQVRQILSEIQGIIVRTCQ
jgi:uncharacterized YigZ family protein